MHGEKRIGEETQNTKLVVNLRKKKTKMKKKKEEKKSKKMCLAEDGFDPSTSGLWAQHAPAAPLC